MSGLKKICSAVGCHTLVPFGQKYCEKHSYLQRRDDERRNQFFIGKSKSEFTEMYALPEWRRLRTAQLRNNPQCAKCGGLATEVHHIIPHRGDMNLFLDQNNLVSLCHDCHLQETQKEIAQRQAERERDKRIGKLWY